MTCSIEYEANDKHRQALMEGVAVVQCTKDKPCSSQAGGDWSKRVDCLLVQELRLKTVNVLICLSIRAEGALNCFGVSSVATDAQPHVMFSF